MEKQYLETIGGIFKVSPLRRFEHQLYRSPWRSFFSISNCGDLLCGGLIISFTEVFSSPIAEASPLRRFFSSPIAGASPLQSFNHLLYGGISHHQLQSILICRNYSNLQLRRFSHLLCGGFRYLSHQRLCNYKELSMYTFFLYAFISVC